MEPMINQAECNARTQCRVYYHDAALFLPPCIDIHHRNGRQLHIILTFAIRILHQPGTAPKPRRSLRQSQLCSAVGLLYNTDPLIQCLFTAHSIQNPNATFHTNNAVRSTHPSRIPTEHETTRACNRPRWRHDSQRRYHRQPQELGLLRFECYEHHKHELHELKHEPERSGLEQMANALVVSRANIGVYTVG